MNHKAYKGYDISSQDGWAALSLNGHIVAMMPSELLCPQGCLPVAEEQCLETTKNMRQKEGLGKFYGKQEKPLKNK